MIRRSVPSSLSCEATEARDEIIGELGRSPRRAFKESCNPFLKTKTANFSATGDFVWSGPGLQKSKSLGKVRSGLIDGKNHQPVVLAQSVDLVVNMVHDLLDLRGLVLFRRIQ